MNATMACWFALPISATASPGTVARHRYLIGCDGPAGVVREALGIELDGLGVVARSVNIFFRSPELAAFHDKGWARFYRVIDATGCWSELIPIDGKELWRLTVFDDPASSRPAEELLRHMAGGEFPYEIISVSPWERRDYTAKSYGGGRVFIAGDPAHECSPTGGIGMHTGLEEVFNLAWKLAAVIEGWGGPALLASYEAERRPIAARNVELATRSFNAIAAIPGWHGESHGDWQADQTWLSIPEFFKLLYSYENSAITASPTARRFPTRSRHAACPPRAPERGRLTAGSAMAVRRSICSATDSSYCASARIPPDTAEEMVAAARARGVPLRQIDLADPAIVKTYERKLVLVRPDGHVAWRGDECPADAIAVIDRIRGAAGVGIEQDSHAARPRVGGDLGAHFEELERAALSPCLRGDERDRSTPWNTR